VASSTFNELFNKIGYVDTVTLEPGKTMEIIVPFIPHLNKEENMEPSAGNFGR
jgi:hypothetical protein